MGKRSKRYAEILKVIEPNKEYTPQEAVAVLKKTANAKFDETVELHLRTAADPKQSDQMMRGTAILPHGLGKTVRVLVFATGDAANLAREAGADYVGDDDLIKKIEEGWVDFEVALATPDMMGRVGRLGRILGRRGLMPNPRTGTVVQPQDLPRVIREAKKGRLDFRMDRTAIIHVPIGKASFPEQHLLENMATLVDTINRLKPAGIKGQFLKSAFLTTTMGPSVKLDLKKFR